MINSDWLGILELCNFHKKSVLCCIFDKSLDHELKNRGAITSSGVNFTKTEEKLVFVSPLTKDNKLHNDKQYFNYAIVDDKQYVTIKNNKSIIVNEYIVVIKGGINAIKFMKRNLHSYDNEKIIMYSVIPSLNKIKMIIPEQFNIKIERYWSLKHKNILTTINLIIEWVFIRRKFLRKLFSDKVVIIK
tara:strand:- start:1129 stop:1692 length:564 start_codon:yes stop_codon:yes gene_type:complete